MRVAGIPSWSVYAARKSDIKKRALFFIVKGGSACTRGLRRLDPNQEALRHNDVQTDPHATRISSSIEHQARWETLPEHTSARIRCHTCLNNKTAALKSKSCLASMVEVLLHCLALGVSQCDMRFAIASYIGQSTTRLHVQSPSLLCAPPFDSILRNNLSSGQRIPMRLTQFILPSLQPPLAATSPRCRGHIFSNLF